MEYGKSKLTKLLANTPREGWNNQKIKDLVDSLWRDPVLLRWSGFENAGGPDTTITWDAVDKIFSIAPLLVTFGFYQYRNKLSFHKRGLSESIDMTAELAEGRYLFFYTYDDVKLKHVLTFIHNPTEAEIKEIYLYKTEVANIYWDATAQEALHFGDDRHGSEWNPQIHRYLHSAFGARRKSGLQFTGYSLNGDGSSNDHAQFNITGGVMLHDDFELAIPGSSTSIPILYSFGTLPRFLANAGYAFAKGASRIYFNSGQISLAQAASGNYVLYHIFATNEILTESRKIISVMGTAEYTALADAYKGVEPELDGIETYMPQQGCCYLGSIVVQTSDDYTNTMRARIVGVVGDEKKGHPPVTIAEGSKTILSINENQELSIYALPAGTDGTNGQNETPTGTTNGANTEFTVGSQPNVYSVRVYLNGVRQHPNDFSVSGNTIAFVTPPYEGDIIQVFYDIYQPNTPVNGESPTGTIDGENKDFELAAVPDTASLNVFLNGILQRLDFGFTVSGTTVSFTNAPYAGDSVIIDYQTSNAAATGTYNQTPAGSIDGSNSNFVLPEVPASVKVYLNGVRQRQDVDFTIAGLTISFTTPPYAGDWILVDYVLS